MGRGGDVGGGTAVFVGRGVGGGVVENCDGVLVGSSGTEAAAMACSAVGLAAAGEAAARLLAWVAVLVGGTASAVAVGGAGVLVGAGVSVGTGV